jgi:uncharacterized membrane protein
MHRRRAAVLIEFVMVLPLFLFLAVLAVDAGRWMLLRSELQDATQQAARAGAQVGGARLVVGDGLGWSEYTFNQALDAYGFSADGRTFAVESGATCNSSGSDRYVTVTATYQVSNPLTPGLTSLLKGVNMGPITLRATSVALCEITPPS